MDGISSSMYTGSGVYQSAQAVLPSGPSKPISIPANITNNSPQEPTRPGHSAGNNDSSFKSSISAGAPSQKINESQVASDATKPEDHSAERQEREQEQQMQQVIAQLRARDQEVRTHEQAHLASAGAYATGGISYEYQTGPDGQKYAVGGSVGIDVSPVSGDPQATIQKAQTVQRAALAPAEPSAQDMRVAAQASQMMMQAQSELRAQQTDEQAENSQEGQQSTERTESANPSAANRIEANPDRNDFELRLSLQPMVAGDYNAIQASNLEQVAS